MQTCVCVSVLPKEMQKCVCVCVLPKERQTYVCVCVCVCVRMHGGTHTHAGYVITGICHGLTHTRYHAEKKRACEIACVKTKHSVVAHTLFKAVSLTPGR